jgi:transglutaminase-like putative cysteine protease
LFISICREQNIPARFEIGFPIPEKRGEGEVGGYHCWAKFVADKQWIPVDISEADKDPSREDYYFGSLTENRVTFTVGRDLELVPKQQAGPVNFLVYPYAEVDGKQHSFFRKGFEYSDL